MTDDELDSLSGVELRRRLTQREVSEASAEIMVRHRDEECGACRTWMKANL